MGTKNRKAGSHSVHWGAVADSDDEVKSFIIGAVEKPRWIESLELHDRKIDTYFSKGEYLNTCTIIVNNEIWTAYPFISSGVVHRIQIDEIEEWENGIEAQIHGGLEDASITFFDTMYFKNKDTYKGGEKYRFSISALAYALSKADSRVIKDIDGMEFSTEGLAGYFPFGEGDVDDFLFQTPVKEVSELGFGDKRVYKVKAALFRADYGSRDVDIFIYASEKATKGYVPKVGEDIGGLLWLQGYLTGDE
jgi:hypothetical protein